MMGEIFRNLKLINTNNQLTIDILVKQWDERQSLTVHLTLFSICKQRLLHVIQYNCTPCRSLASLSNAYAFLYFLLCMQPRNIVKTKYS